jgi:hypothetical protein
MFHKAPFSRRALLACGAAGLVLSAVPRSAAAQGAGPGNRRFTVLYKGGKIGEHTIANSSATGETRVNTEIRLVVKAAFITVFSYNHKSEEIWRDGRLVALKSDTEEGSDRFRVEGASVPEGFRIIGKGGPFVAPVGALTSNSLWLRSVLDQKTVIDAQHGGMTGVSVTKLGEEQVVVAGRQTPATRYKLITPYLAGLIWYDNADHWVRGEFERDGARIDYQLVT